MPDREEIKIDISPVMEVLNQLQAKLTSEKPRLMGNISLIMADAIEENFAKEGRPKPWQELAPSTIKQREKKGHWPGKILQQSGQLAAANIPDHDENSASVTNSKIYGPIQNFGGWTGRDHKTYIPPRPFMVLADNDIEEIGHTIVRFLNVKD